MSFEQLIAKVHQAEDVVEAQERRLVANLRQVQHSWREAWTPGRIVIAGLVSGFAVGRAEPLRVAAKSGGMMQMVSMLSSLFAGGSAGVAASQAERAADNTQTVAAAIEEGEDAVVARAEATVQAVRSAADPIDF
ncbi:hypothetical protein ASE35_08775 [Lysobacter sp. Root916]|uniref:hypothetical protein n=1 Tax=Lysobacter sp. Root916 TaxID=1736606 RepID=UPI00070A7BDA|nr:hypothetical protein [Lysobacter sp. Root916]KRD34812.1 hypothetical protein ASE35_08775 [Lysobacter sp. Root916]